MRVDGNRIAGTTLITKLGPKGDATCAEIMTSQASWPKPHTLRHSLVIVAIVAVSVITHALDWSALSGWFFWGAFAYAIGVSLIFCSQWLWAWCRGRGER